MPEFLHVRSESKFINDPRSPAFTLTCCMQKTIIVINYWLEAKEARATTSLSLFMMLEWQLTIITTLLLHTPGTHLPV